MNLWILILEIKSVIDENNNVKIPPIPLLHIVGFARTEVDAKTQAVALNAAGFNVVVVGPLPIDFQLP